MALTTIAQVRLITGLTTSDVSDADLTSLISEATKEILRKINVKVIREKVSYIDETRENDINGVNTTYYIKNWKGKFLSDFDYDGDVDTSDIKVYAIARDGTETDAVVSSVTFNKGRFVLNTAYNSSYDLYIDYVWSYYDVATPDPTLQLAATYLVASYGYLKKDSGFSGSIKFGNTSINKKISADFDIYYSRYSKIISELISGSPAIGFSRESEVQI